MEAIKQLGKDDSDGTQFLTFLLEGDIYGVDILQVKEIIEYGNLTPIPMMPDFIRGVLNLRGHVVPIIDLVARFGQRPADISKRTCLIIVELTVDDTVLEFGMLVDSVNEVVEIRHDHIAPTPSFGTKIRSDFIQSMGKIDDNFIVLLNIDCVLSIDELSALAEANQDISDASHLNNEQDSEIES